MINVIPKEEGYRVGTISEKKFEERCQQNKIVYVSTKVLNGWTPQFDLINGDEIIFIKDKIARVDVKGGALGRHSMMNFRGEYFVIYENSNESAKNGLVFGPSVIRTLTSNMKDKDFDAMAFSGEQGILYSRLIQFKKYAITIDEFFQNFS
jgi:hypothetical protein